MRHNGGGGLIVFTLFLLLKGGTCGVVADNIVPDRTGFQVLRLQATDDSLVERALSLAEEHDLRDWVELNRPKRYVDVMVHPDARARFARAAEDAGIETSIMIHDVEDIITRHVIRRRSAEDDKYDYTKFNTFENVEKELKHIAKTHSDIAELVTMGTTHEQRNMYALRVTNNIGPKPTKPIVLIDAGIHAREWVSVSTIMYIINEVVRNPGNDLLIRAFRDSYDFVFMPVLNPDGYVYTWTHDRLWRKNRAPNHHSRCVGVDLNRNWDYKWGGEGTSANPCDIDFRGRRPFSELETQAVKQWIEEYKSKIVLYINFHAYGQLWMTPYGYSQDTPSNESEMMNYSKIAVDAIRNVRGTDYDFGPVYTTIYPASSISVDWVRGAENILIAYTVELPDRGRHGFITPEWEITPIGQETWTGIERLLIALGSDKKLLRTTEIVVV